jgi:iron complex transport system substrate-binding protein
MTAPDRASRALGLGRRQLLPLGFGLAAARPAAAAEPPSRIVSIGGALTETVFALGQGARVVAVDTTSRHPRPAAALPRIGYMRALPTEGIVALAPDLLLMSGDAGPAEVLAVLRAARVPTVVVPDEAGPGAPAAKARAVAAALGQDGAALARALEADWAMLDAPLATARAHPAPRVLFVLSLARGAPLVSGRSTHADAMITAAGGENAVRGFEGYKPLSAEAAVALAPDVILMMDHALAEAGGGAALRTVPALAVTPAVRQGRVVAMDGPYLLNFGPRAAAARRDLAARLHPALDLPALPERPWTAA